MASGQQVRLTPTAAPYYPLTSWSVIMAAQIPAANPFNYISAPRLEYSLAEAAHGSLDFAAGLVDSALDRENLASRWDGLQFLRKKSGEGDLPGFWGHLEAGYGHFYRLPSSKSIMELEQPSCAYLMAKFSF